MQTAKIFKSGNSQAVRLPRDFRFDDTDVYIKKLDDIIILLPRKGSWSSLLKSLHAFSDDFMIERVQPDEQMRDVL
ncbi:AbrB/MazE/SpoVT family DNA-binding domain-containing protein [candidate division KSB1 bacterium]|nr:AbrB/MazE/SpoVT family DNA-binding domain-containing protein [candidate division KSB1 bacterium]RQW02727.1 MAG: AbrB/MazE/SpoVT family DNA-binding domain-containing protein [candidate division KSB1 bacterium]